MVFPTPSPATPTIFLSQSLPGELTSEAHFGFAAISDDPESTYWFGPEFQAPDGEILYTSAWVYALAAPFPTLIDSISLDKLRDFWQGDHPSDLESVTRLYLPKSVVDHFADLWGANNSQTTVTFIQTLPDAETLWEENAWAILPFDALEPKLKVIQIDGVSPLFKDFSASSYPLTLQYLLVKQCLGPGASTEVEIQPILDSLPTTNRDPEKMTTLVMTGVTALVRAIADRMEKKGILYPGEAIGGWLAEADLTHISNEVSFYKNCLPPDPNSRSLFFCSDPKYIELFEFVGADIIELTGNHNNDILRRDGKYIVPYNLQLYRDHGMVYFGGGSNLENARAPLVLTHNGNQLGFIGCNAPGPEFAWATKYRGGAAPCGDFQWMVDEIQNLKSEGILPIATFQYYEDYYNFAETHHWRDYGLIAEAGAVIVNGSQAHRPKAMAFIGETLVDFGLGNLFFDQMGYTDMYGNNLQQVRWEKIQRHTFYDGRLLSTELLTAILEDYAQPRPMTPEERFVFLLEIFTASNWISR